MTRVRVGLLVVGSVASVAAAALVWSGDRREAAPLGVVIVTLDTTRADRLSPYGYMNVSLPAFERLAREGVVFDHATSVAPLTLTAHTSLFTGLLPPNHGVRDNIDRPLAASHPTLAEILSARGFRTGAFVGSVVLDPDRGLKRGFDEYRGVDEKDRHAPEARQRPANEVVDDAIRWLDTVAGSRFFLWTHLYDAHRPYNPPEPYRSIYAHDPYLGEIAFADSQVGRLLSALEERHVLNRSVVIVAADHGESLGDHGERDHGIFVYEDVLRVPLFIRAAGLAASRVGAVVRLTDVMPTVLDMLDVPSPAMDGVSLVDLLHGRRLDLDLEAYSESLYPERLGWSSLRALRDSRFKVIDAPDPELYDLWHDPFEQHNIYEERRALATAMTARLESIGKGRDTGTASRQTGATPELRARLAALGYVGSAGVRNTSDRALLPDPKDCIAAYTGEPRTQGRAECGPWRPLDAAAAVFKEPDPAHHRK